jgi:hypothetical protein
MENDLTRALRSTLQTPKVRGIVDVVLRNPDGSIADHVHKENMVTDLYRMEFVFRDYIMDTQYLFIHENNRPMHIKRTAMRTVMPGTFDMSVTASKDGPNRLWTYSTVFAAPPSNRTFQTVGLSEYHETGAYTNVHPGPKAILAATVLGAPLTQLTTQTLEVTYRLAFQRT